MSISFFSQKLVTNIPPRNLITSILVIGITKNAQIDLYQSLCVIKLQFYELKNKATFRIYDREHIVLVIVFTNCDSSERNPCDRDYSYSLSGGMLTAI